MGHPRLRLAIPGPRLTRKERSRTWATSPEDLYDMTDARLVKEIVKGRREQGVVLGLTQSITSVSQIVAPIIAGALIDRRQLGAWAILMAAVAFVGMLVSLRSARTTG